MIGARNLYWLFCHARLCHTYLILWPSIFVTTHPRGPRWLVLAVRIRLAAPVLAPLYLFLPNIFSRSISTLTILADYIGSRWLASMQLSAR